MDFEDELFCEMARCGSVRWDPKGNFSLKSGLRSAVFIGLGRRDATEHIKLLFMLGRRILDVLREAGADRRGKQICLIGVPTAGIPLAQAAAMVNYEKEVLQNSVVFRLIRPYVRIAEGSAGLMGRSWMDGVPNSAKQDCWLIENVISTAGSVLMAYSRLLEHGYNASDVSVLSLVDRELNGRERLRKAGISKIASAWKITDFVSRMERMGFLPREAVSRVQEEIRAFHDDRPF